MQLSLSTSAGYAIHALHYIANSDSEGPVLVRQIADEHHIPYDSTLKILRLLSKAGFVTAHRGCTGGFSLKKKPDKITLLDVVSTIDGPIESSDPLPAKAGSKKVKSGTDKLLKEAMLELRRRLAKTTIADL